jgi:hypothetical protein
MWYEQSCFLIFLYFIKRVSRSTYEPYSNVWLVLNSQKPKKTSKKKHEPKETASACPCPAIRVSQWAPLPTLPPSSLWALCCLYIVPRSSLCYLSVLSLPSHRLPKNWWKVAAAARTWPAWTWHRSSRRGGRAQTTFSAGEGDNEGESESVGIHAARNKQTN